MKPSNFFFSWCVFIPTFSVFLGAFIMMQSGIDVRIWGQNIATWFLGMIFWLFFRIWNPSPFHRGITIFVLSYPFPAFIALSFFDVGMQGVHRWVSIGSVRVHIASIVLPAFLITFRRIAAIGAAGILAISIAGLLAFQPDASEASAFTAGMLLLLLRGQMGRVTKMISAPVLVASMILAWVIRDPLPAVPHVEGIINLAAAIHPLLAVASIISIVTLPLPFLWPRPRGSNAQLDTAVALGLYFCVKLFVSAVTQKFPIMLLGFGASPIIGYFVALIWLGIVRRTRSENVSAEYFTPIKPNSSVVTK